MRLIRNFAALAGLLTLVSGTATASATTISIHEKIGIAQRIVQGMEHFDPTDDLTLSGANATPIAGELSSAYFLCGTCRAFDNLGEVDVYSTHAQAISEAESYVEMLQGTGLHAPAFVAGEAVFTLIDSSARIDRAFGRAVGKPVTTIKLSLSG